MRKTLPLNFILPLLIPMAIAGLMVRFGGGPTSEDVVAELESQDPEVRERALEWLQVIKRPSLLDEATPHMFKENEPDPDVADEALEVIRRTGSPHSLEALDRAFKENHLDQTDVLRAFGKVRFPQTLPYIEKHFDHPDPEVREAARKYAREVRVAINHEIVFYSLGNPIYNKMGYLIYSQALAFPEGREMVEGTPVEPVAEGEAPES